MTRQVRTIPGCHGKIRTNGSIQRVQKHPLDTALSGTFPPVDCQDSSFPLQTARTGKLGAETHSPAAAKQPPTPRRGIYSKSVCQKYNKPVDYPENRCIVKLVKEKTNSPISRMED